LRRDAGAIEQLLGRAAKRQFAALRLLTCFAEEIACVLDGATC
jgi:hypothetical protein